MTFNRVTEITPSKKRTIDELTPGTLFHYNNCENFYMRIEPCTFYNMVALKDGRVYRGDNGDITVVSALSLISNVS